MSILRKRILLESARVSSLRSALYIKVMLFSRSAVFDFSLLCELATLLVANILAASLVTRSDRRYTTVQILFEKFEQPLKGLLKANANNLGSRLFLLRGLCLVGFGNSCLWRLFGFLGCKFFSCWFGGWLLSCRFLAFTAFFSPVGFFTFFDVLAFVWSSSF